MSEDFRITDCATGNFSVWYLDGEERGGLDGAMAYLKNECGFDHADAARYLKNLSHYRDSVELVDYRAWVRHGKNGPVPRRYRLW